MAGRGWSAVRGVRLQGAVWAVAPGSAAGACRGHTSAPEVAAACCTRAQGTARAARCSSSGIGAQAVAYRNWKGCQPVRIASSGAPSSRQNRAQGTGSSASSSNRVPHRPVNGGPPGASDTASVSGAFAAARYWPRVSSAARSTPVVTCAGCAPPRAWPSRAASRPCTVSTEAQVAA